ncbi:MAG: transcriptional regulator GcvA [Myxococcales bacterium]|nr:MAG: transcriptional regulator GcvA [Myxococcales bacterium]
MDPALPSLRALQVFEVAARLGSFTKAAGELRVTQTAVSHQIKQLEEELEAPLFRRMGRGLSLTPAGQAWFAELTRVFGQLRETNRKLRSRPRERPLVSLTTLPSFAARWLVPRLGLFLARHPEVDLRISTSEAVVDFTLEPVDVGIRFGTGPYRGLFSEKLFEDVFITVASPELAQRLHRPRDLAQSPLLKDDHEGAWPRWFQAQGLGSPATARYHQLLDSGLLVEAAVRGQGVALARWSLVRDELTAGRLRRVFPKLPALPVGHAYHLVGLRETFRRREIAAFRSWLRGEIRELGREMPSAK